MRNSTILLVIVLSCYFGLIGAKLEQPYNELQFNSNSLSAGKRSLSAATTNQEKVHVTSHRDNDVKTQFEPKQPAVEERLLISEPYKSLVQTSARMVLSNTELGKRLNLDAVMNFLNDAGYLLSKKVILITTMKVLTAIMGTISLAVFFLPGVPQFLEATWKNPAKTLGLKKYLAGGIHEKSLLNVLDMRTNELVARIGLDQENCRQKSICHAGEMIKSIAPQTINDTILFLNENFPNIDLSNNKFLNAFTSGVVNGDCQAFGSQGTRTAPMCLGNFMDTFMTTTGLRRR